MEISLSGRSAIVTGGSKGLGLRVATRFAQSGADVAIVARGREALDEAVKAIRRRRKGTVIGVRPTSRVAADVKRTYDEAMTGVRQGRHRRQQCRHVARRRVRDADRRGHAARISTRSCSPRSG